MLALLATPLAYALATPRAPPLRHRSVRCTASTEDDVDLGPPLSSANARQVDLGPPLSATNARSSHGLQSAVLWAERESCAQSCVCGKPRTPL